MKKTITQSMVASILDVAKTTLYIKPTAFAVVVVDESNRDMVTKSVTISKGSTGYDVVTLGTVDSVDYNTLYHAVDGMLKIGTGITLSVTGEGKLDAYPNPNILDSDRFKHLPSHDGVPDLNTLRSLCVPEVLLNEVSFYTKLVSVPMITIGELKSLLNITGEVVIEATWGVQNDVEDHDYIVLSSRDYYKVDMDATTGLPEKYERLV